MFNKKTAVIIILVAVFVTAAVMVSSDTKDIETKKGQHYYPNYDLDTKKYISEYALNESDNTQISEEMADEIIEYLFVQHAEGMRHFGDPSIPVDEKRDLYFYMIDKTSNGTQAIYQKYGFDGAAYVQIQHIKNIEQGISSMNDANLQKISPALAEPQK